MKRKKWKEAEEETLISAYSELVSSCGKISQLRTREKKFQPIADRVNSLHHLCDATAFPFRWSWRDVSIKIQNMRHQYIGVKLKLSSSSAAEGPDLDHCLQLWPNFLRYKAVFGDIDPHPSASSSSSASAYASAASDDGKIENLGKMVAELGVVLVGREESRREREGCDRECRRQRGSEMQALAAMVVSDEEEERRQRWRRREERREEEEMEWRERMLGMQMEHEKQVMQMHAEACQAQMQMLSILVRFVCQFLSPTASSGAGGSDGGINGLQHHVMHNLQHQQQQSPGSLVVDNVKNDVPSGEDYL
ncbi:uncharacterized protein LOC110031841 [Phalaenopsis equestris]|uniref:uncharacterized protein LOC110031841 n=1 Tax=Phalaenopsis equestris TaxID=78828 RepID=UPI0009E2B862|nr:uncharacterized protein LOC110031841 [Phalaenopsis equestris]